MTDFLRFAPGGDTAFYACLGEEGIDEAVNQRVHALAAALKGVAGITDLIPGYWNLLIEFEPLLTTRARLERIIKRRLPTLRVSRQGRELVIPVRYDGLDLEEVERLTSLTRAELIKAHAEPVYTVYAIGFTPGFPYLGVLSERLRVPRLATPRASTPANSVAIAGMQTGIYPMPSPGGWRVIGTALESVFDPQRHNPFLLEAGDRVRFKPALAATPDPVRAAPTQPEAQRGEAVFRVLEAGLQSSLQDLGRQQVGRYGLARAGALDARAHRLANALVGNAAHHPTLEMTLRGPKLEVLSDAVLAVAGAGLSLRRNGQGISLQRSFAVRRGDTLEFPPAAHGTRAYLALRGGFVGHEAYGSQSTDLRAGLGGQRLEPGTWLFGAEPNNKARSGFDFLGLRSQLETVLRLCPGPQAALFPAEAWRALTEGAYRVAAADRMGLRLHGAALSAERLEIVSEGVPVGSLQVSGDGQPMLLLNDRGTLGGYAKIAVLRRADLPRAAQLRPGAFVRFRLEDSSW